MLFGALVNQAGPRQPTADNRTGSLHGKMTARLALLGIALLSLLWIAAAAY
jgi:hypothetical protein